jgi:ribonuclease D
VDKGALLSDWENRPLTPEQCQYAVKDVVYLHPLMVALKRRLKRAGKLEWALEENQRLEDRDYYKTDPLDFLNTAQVNQLNKKQKVFLMRMHMWRHLEAEKENRPLTQIMKTGVLNTIVQKIPSGETTLLKDRTLPTRFMRENLDTFRRLYEKKISPHEKELLDQASETPGISSRNGVLMDMLHQLVKYRGMQQGVSSKLIIPGKEMQKMKANMKYIPPDLKKGWRKQVIGKQLLKLLETRKDFYVSIKKNKFTLYMGRKPGSFFKNLLKGKERDEELS